MPPIDSDQSDIPFELSATATNDNADVEGSDDDDEGGEEEFIVESILNHKWSKGTYMYQVKWEGYEDAADLTWEPETNLETAAEALKKYFKIIGGRPEPPASAKKRGLKAGSKKRPAEEDTPDSTPGKGRRGRKKLNTGGSDEDESSLDVDRVIDVTSKKTKYPPKGTKWDEYVAAIRTIEEQPSKMRTKERWGVVAWDNGELTRHRLALLHESAPKAMLKFYESNLVFKSNNNTDLDTNGSIHAVDDENTYKIASRIKQSTTGATKDEEEDEE